MSRPDIDGIRKSLETHRRSEASRNAIEILLDYVAELEAELEGYRRREPGTMQRSIAAQRGK